MLEKNERARHADDQRYKRLLKTEKLLQEIDKSLESTKHLRGKCPPEYARAVRNMTMEELLIEMKRSLNSTQHIREEWEKKKHKLRSDLPEDTKK